MTPELRNIWESSLWKVASTIVNYTEDDRLETFARLVAEDCAKIAEDLDNGEVRDDCICVDHAATAIRSKYAP